MWPTRKQAIGWESHYTGIETCSIETRTLWRRKFNLYRQRDTKTKRLQFIRLTYVVSAGCDNGGPCVEGCLGRCIKSRMIGMFLDKVNHLSRLGWGTGWEIWAMNFPFDWQVGWVSHGSKRWFAGAWGRNNESVVWRVNRLGFGHSVLKFVTRWRNHQDEIEMERQAAAYDEMMKAQGWDDFPPDEEEVPPYRDLQYRL